jgi:ribosomal protein S18 acetylase RimI-like enzyme
MNISIERATAVDAEALVKVQMAAFHHNGELYPEIEGGPPGYDSVEVMLQKIQRNESYKIVDAEQCIGGMVVFDQGQGHYHLDVIFIDPIYHDRGIGTQAMRFLEQTYPAKLWTLDAAKWEVRNHHFYEKLGYVKVREYEIDSFPLIAYEKHILNSSQ